MFKKIKEYFTIPVDKQYYIEYHIKIGDYIARINYKGTGSYDYKVDTALHAMTNGFYQDGVVYSPYTITKALIKEAGVT